MSVESSTIANVEFSEPPLPANRTNTEIYDEVARQLRARPGHWGKCAEVVGRKALFRWNAAMKKRGILFSQRKVREDTWAVWCMFPESVN